MRTILCLTLLTATSAFAQTPNPVPNPAPAKPVPAPVTLRSTLLAQLHSTHDTAEWFTPINTAVGGLTPEQAKWVPANAAGKLDPNANHSAGMLAYHLLFWNARALQRLKGETPAAAPNNDETFNDFDAATWAKTVLDLDANMRAPLRLYG